MGKVYDYDELVNNKKKADRRAWVYEKVNKAKWFVEDHKAQIAAVAAATPVVVGTIMQIARMVSQQDRLKKAKDLKELYCYDRSLGHYWKLRRELTNDEWLAIDARKRSGERLADILKELNVLA